VDYTINYEKFIQSDEEIRTELAQKGVDFMRGVDDIFMISKCVQIACFLEVLSLKHKIFYVRKHGNVAENSGSVHYKRLMEILGEVQKVNEVQNVHQVQKVNEVQNVTEV